MNLELDGKVAIVTGASRGIGRAIATQLADEGARVCMAARGEADLKSAADAIAASGGDVIAVPTDVADDAAVAHLVASAREAFGTIDIVISNASPIAIGRSREDWEKCLSVDLMGAVRMVEETLPAMRDKDGGAIVLISSGSAIEATPMDDLGYTSAKAALNALAQKLAQVEGPHNIRVNALLPGSIEFPGGTWDTIRSEAPELYAMASASVPSGRLGTPEEVADAVLWLVSPRASWVNGASIVVDGAQSKSIR